MYEFDFSYDDGKWTLVTAHIGDGVLHIDDIVGRGTRYTDDDWGQEEGDFEFEVDVKSDSLKTSTHWAIYLNFTGGVPSVVFEGEGTNIIELRSPIGTLRASGPAQINDTDWHKVKIARRGTVYYLSVDDGAIISYDYGSIETINNITLSYAFVQGSYDNFMFSEEGNYGFIL
jgi:hypothetical protein